jgi:hypothetical protein
LGFDPNSGCGVHNSGKKQGFHQQVHIVKQTSGIHREDQLLIVLVALATFGLFAYILPTGKRLNIRQHSIHLTLMRSIELHDIFDRLKTNPKV